MSFRDELPTLYDFLKNTQEGNLRKMLVEPSGLTDAHFRLLMRFVKGCTEDQLAGHIEKSEFPKIKLNPKEIALRETFWDVCYKAFISRGLASKMPEAPATPTIPQAA